MAGLLTVQPGCLEESSFYCDCPQLIYSPHTNPGTPGKEDLRGDDTYKGPKIELPKPLWGEYHLQIKLAPKQYFKLVKKKSYLLYNYIQNFCFSFSLVSTPPVSSTQFQEVSKERVQRVSFFLSTELFFCCYLLYGFNVIYLCVPHEEQQTKLLYCASRLGSLSAKDTSYLILSLNAITLTGQWKDSCKEQNFLM